MIRIEGPDQSILYTGDFKTRSSHTAELADFPKSDILIMEQSRWSSSERWMKAIVNRSQSP